MGKELQARKSTRRISTLKVTCKTILIDFLSKQITLGRKTIYSHILEEDLVKWGSNYWGVKHNPSTYSRAWRKLKEDGNIPEIDVIKIVKRKDTSRNETGWTLITV